MNSISNTPVSNLSTAPLLVEILSEELPPKALHQLGQCFAQQVAAQLHELGLLADNRNYQAFATPRRLAVLLQNVKTQGSTETITEKWMPKKIAFDQSGNPSAALIKRLQKAGISADDPGLFEQQEQQQTYLYYRYQKTGSVLSEILSGVLEKAIAALPVPKMMSYQNHLDETFHSVRPARGLVALYGDEVLPIHLMGLTAGRSTLGHRFLAKQILNLQNANDYSSELNKQGFVIANYEERRAQIKQALHQAAGDNQVLMPENLLDEVSALVEWPVVYVGQFDDAFLAVPQECLILTMQTHQKYFALTDSQGKLRSRFLIVSNLAVENPENIITGNQKVVRARLADAQFFFEHDKQRRLEDRLDALKQVVYHNKLGSQYDRVQRLQKISFWIAHELQLDEQTKKDVDRAAMLAKADLSTDMVGEFPELQGIMGAYYAEHDGESSAVAQAIKEHYQPRFAKDDVPQSVVGSIVALADKLETLVGIWGIGLKPTGEKDPFALRRHALGIVRILLRNRWPLSLHYLIYITWGMFGKYAFPINPEELKKLGTEDFTKSPEFIETHNFILERCSSLLREQGYSVHEIEAVLSQKPETLDTLIERLLAIRSFMQLPEAQVLVGLHKRIRNILKKTEEDIPTSIANQWQSTEEKNLASLIAEQMPIIDEACAKKAYQDALFKLSLFKEPIDQFFNNVMVMVEDTELRKQRLYLLQQLAKMMDSVADISKLSA